jgi:hypothetical protein
MEPRLVDDSYTRIHNFFPLINPLFQYDYIEYRYQQLSMTITYPLESLPFSAITTGYVLLVN